MTFAQNSLIVRLPNWVGDVVMTLPALQVLKDNGVALQLLGKPWIKDLLAGTGMPVLSLEQKFWQTRNKLSAMPANKTLLFTNSFSSAFLSRMAGKKTIGYKSDKRQLLLKASIAKSFGQHDVEYFWNIARFASQYWFPESPWPVNIPSKISLPLRDSSIAHAQQLLQGANIHKPYLVICPFAHGKGLNNQSKIWPHWREFSRQMADKPVIVCPGVNEERKCADLVPEATILSGLNLGDYAAVLAGAEQVIANDSGPMHLATAVGANTLGIFGVSDPLKTGPWGARYIGSKYQWPGLEEVVRQVQTTPSVP